MFKPGPCQGSLQSSLSCHPGQCCSSLKDRATAFCWVPSSIQDLPAPSEPGWSRNTAQPHKAKGPRPPSLWLKQGTSGECTSLGPCPVLAGAGPYPLDRPPPCTCSSGSPWVISQEKADSLMRRDKASPHMGTGSLAHLGAKPKSSSTGLTSTHATLKERLRSPLPLRYAGPHPFYLEPSVWA